MRSTRTVGGRTRKQEGEGVVMLTWGVVTWLFPFLATGRGRRCLLLPCEIRLPSRKNGRMATETPFPSGMGTHRRNRRGFQVRFTSWQAHVRQYKESQVWMLGVATERRRGWWTNGVLYDDILVWQLLCSLKYQVWPAKNCFGPGSMNIVNHSRLSIDISGVFYTLYFLGYLHQF